MNMKKRMKVAVVTGANSGLGLETCRQLGRTGMTVVLTARDEQKAREAATELQKERLMVCFHALDVADQASVDRLAKFVAEKWGYLDALVNNAGVMPESTGKDTSILDATARQMLDVFDVNCAGAFRVAAALAPVMRKGGGGCIVNVSSILGQLEGMEMGYAPYRISKAAMNALTRILAAETKGAKIRVNSVCPGWVRTDMGGPHADRSVEEGADGIVWLATLPPDGPTGGFFRDRKPIPW